MRYVGTIHYMCRMWEHRTIFNGKNLNLKTVQIFSATTKLPCPSNNLQRMHYFGVDCSKFKYIQIQIKFQLKSIVMWCDL